MTYTYYEQKKIWYNKPNGLNGVVKRYTFWSLTDFCNDTVELIDADIMYVKNGTIIRHAKINKLPELKLTFVIQ